MEAKEIIMGLKTLCSLYNYKLDLENEAIAKIWIDGLKDLSPKVYGSALFDITKHEEFFPKIATIRKYASKFKEQVRVNSDIQAIEEIANPEQLKEARIKMNCIRKALELGDMQSLRDASCFRKYRDENAGCTFDQMAGAC